MMEVSGVASDGDCPVTFQMIGSQLKSVPANTSGLVASWYVINSGDSNLPVGLRTCLRSGNVTACTAPNFGSYLPANSQTDADVVYTTGSAGSGTVSLRLSVSGCPTLYSPEYTLSIKN